jgi:hypothetical protein
MRIASLVWLVVFTAACTRSHLEPGPAVRDRDAAGDDAPAAAGRGEAGGGGGGGGARDPGDPSHGGQGGADAVALPGLDAAVPTMGGAGSASTAPDEPASAAEPTQVWIGQLWSIAPLLCDPNAPWSSAPLVVQPMGYTERVVLILELGDDPAKPSGVIAFGEGELPAEPEIPAGGRDSGSFWLCSNQIPSEGGEYTVLDARRSSDRLTFEIAPSEIWNASCDDGDPSCHCETAHCVAFTEQRRSLDFLVTGDEMQTTFLAAAFGTAGELRLRRVE